MSGKIRRDWWRETLTRSRFLVGGFGLLGGATTLGGCYDWVRAGELVQQRDEIDGSIRSLELQRQIGWDVGQPGGQLQFPGDLKYDIDGTEAWRGKLEGMAALLAPAQPALSPYYVPTLFQSLQGPASQALRVALHPILTPEMQRAYARGRAILSLFDQASWPSDTAILIDLPGPESIALAAALSDRFEPVFGFDNWPHPLGVVPSHQTLAATLYYLPLFERARLARPTPTPPALVLDANRLRPYGDDDGKFDNRYIAKLPLADGWKQLGISHALYVTSGGTSAELDDLNGAFVELLAKGIDVKTIDLNDFEESDTPPPAEYADLSWTQSGTRYLYFGGDPWSHLGFWNWYGWYPCVHPGPTSTAPPSHCSRGFHYRAALRPTIFRGAALSHLGRAAVRTSRSTGTVSTLSLGRSGSLGRFHSAVGS